MATCFQCLRGMCTTHETSNSTSAAELPDAPNLDAEDTDGDRDEERPLQHSAKRARRTKPDAALTDQQSTGRKRAARLYPLHRDQSCEWRLKSGQGGGDNPIVGCTDGMQLARHHGPDKNTLNNDEGNVHRICHHCHNRWHAKNDPDYDPNKPLKS